jgi:hypothetical protein
MSAMLPSEISSSVEEHKSLGLVGSHSSHVHREARPSSHPDIASLPTCVNVGRSRRLKSDVLVNRVDLWEDD